MTRNFKNRSFRKYKRNKLLNLGKIFLVVLFMIAFCGTVFNVGDIMSSIITNKGSLFYRDKVESPAYSVFGVSADDFNNEEEANKLAVSIRQRGAMGQVYKSGEYFVLANTYPTLAEAMEVQDNLLLLDYNARIVSITIPELRFDYFGRNKQFATDALVQFKNIYTNLYLISVDFDKDKLSRVNFNGKIATVLSQNLEMINNLKTAGFSQKQTLEISNGLKNVNNILEDVLYSTQSDTEVSSFLKRQMLKIVEENIKLVGILA